MLSLSTCTNLPRFYDIRRYNKYSHFMRDFLQCNGETLGEAEGYKSPHRLLLFLSN